MAEVSVLKKVGLFFVAAIIGAVAVGVLSPNSAHAVVRDPYNTPEASAKALCPDIPSARRGAIWISSSSDYYNADVQVAAASDTVTVYVRGSVYNCDSPRKGDTYATDVSSGGSSGWRLELDTTTLYRGYSEGYRNWSTQGGQISATLDVKGLATPAQVGKTTSQTIYIDLDRCFSTSSTITTGICYPEIIAITVTRAAIEYDYQLTPNPPSTLPSTVESGTIIPSISGRIDNSGTTKSRDDTVWQLTMYVGEERAATKNNTAPCGGVGEGVYSGTNFGESCESLQRGGGSIGTDGQTVTKNNVPIGEVDVGDRICFAVSVRAAANDDSRWAHSASRCVVVSKKPKVQVLGGDLWVGRSSSTPSNISTGISVITSPSPTRTYGSYSEYGLLASGSVVGMASGSGYAGGSSTSNLCQLSLLTFNNSSDTSCTANEIGNYNKLSSNGASLGSRFPVSQGAPALSGTVRLSDRPSGIYTASSGTLNLTDATIEGGKWYVINAPNADVRITGNITYTNAALGSVSEIPQVVIIARNISINESASRVDAWLVASGTGTNGRLNTCRRSSTDETTVGAGINAEVCATRLTVNGPVVANHLLLRRTAGAG
ncbi:hypothetical protein GW746_01290, partial [Candidatus Saccharibacteria bacterium]|nr:hypothetical protein [Candidatus Saccharibacteria bacterium]